MYELNNKYNSTSKVRGNDGLCMLNRCVKIKTVGNIALPLLKEIKKNKTKLNKSEFFYKYIFFKNFGSDYFFIIFKSLTHICFVMSMIYSYKMRKVYSLSGFICSLVYL